MEESNLKCLLKMEEGLEVFQTEETNYKSSRPSGELSCSEQQLEIFYSRKTFWWLLYPLCFLVTLHAGSSQSILLAENLVENCSEKNSKIHPLSRMWIP